jgi:secreted trypsin-like serine protease
MYLMQKKKFRLLGGVAVLVAIAALLPWAASAEPDSGVRTSIVGGNQASLKDHPYAVYLTDSSGNQFCGAVLINSSAVATAAHCAKAMSSSEMRVVAGREDKRTSDGVVVPVSGVWVQPEFKDPSAGNDIAVLKLAKSVPYQAVRLPKANDSSLYAAGTDATVLGWGRLAADGARSDYLRSATVPIVSNQGCAQTFSNYDAESMVCAGVPAGGVDACQGDSGGPLVVNGTLVGIVSYGEGCGEPNKPGVYARVSSFVSDLKSHS